MATIYGHNGQVDLGGVVNSDVSYNTHAWSLDITADVADITDFTTNGWRKYASGGLKGWTGSVELYVDGTNRIVPSDVSSEVTGHFYHSSGVMLAGKCIISGWHPAVSVDGIQTQTLDVQGSSDLFTG